MSIDYGAESEFSAPVMRIDDEGHGFVGVVYAAATRQSIDYDTNKPKWFRNRAVVLSDQPQPGDQPVLDYVFHIAVEKGKGAFTRRDENGDAVKLSSGKNALDVRTLDNEDIAVVFSSAWMSRLAKSVKMNPGQRVRMKRLTPARDEAGDRMTEVHGEIEVLGTVDDPQPFKPSATAAAVDYDAPAAPAQSTPEIDEF